MDNSEKIRQEYDADREAFVRKYGQSPYDEFGIPTPMAINTGEMRIRKIAVDISLVLNNARLNRRLGSNLGDIGSYIGEVVGRYIDNTDGFETGDFINGIEHGISLANGTHDK